jgi:hypothetical protein
MILLDMNVVLEPLRPAPETRAIDWIDTPAGDALPFQAAGLDVINPWERT